MSIHSAMLLLLLGLSAISSTVKQSFVPSRAFNPSISNVSTQSNLDLSERSKTSFSNLET